MKEKGLPSDILFDPSALRHIITSSRLSVFGGMGECYRDMEGPVIAIANSWTDINPGHMHLDRLARAVRDGVLQAGGVPFEFHVPAPCDATSCGLETMKYILPQRDLIADSTEMMVRCNSFDGIVFLSSCDKIVPGQLMAAARLGLPAIFVTGGPMLPRLFFAPKDPALQNLHETYLQHPTEEHARDLFAYSAPGPGACSGFGTANTMQCIAEILGLTLPNCATICAVDSAKLRIARESGRRIVEMVRGGLGVDRILTPDAFHNAICAHTAMGGSTNGVLHLLAIAHEGGVPLSIDDFDRLGRDIPCVSGVYPSGRYELLDLYRAGGVPALLKRIQTFLKGKALAVNGKNLEENLEQAVIYDEEVIRPLDSPFEPGGGLAVLRGNLAPDSSVIKASAVRAGMRTHTGPAICFNSEVEAREGLDKGVVEPGSVIVIRYEGPKGGPGMREMLLITRYLVYSGKADNVALVTDGRFSGFTAGPAVGHVCPEAAEGGPIALVRDGDSITIDIPGRALTLHVSDQELARRREGWQPIRRGDGGYLARYARSVRPACQGAWLE